MKLVKKFLCLILVLTTAFSVMSIASAGLVAHAASADTYISTTYAANLSIKTEKVTNLMDLPTTASGSQVKYTIPADTMLTAKALYKNTSGEYWYKVIYYNLTLYVNAAHTLMVDHLTGDIKAENLQSPAALQYGYGFPIGGEVTSVYNNIGKISASMYYGSNLTRLPALTSSDTVNGKYYNLTGSTVDNNLWFSDLSAGVYTYVVTAEAVSYYIDSNDTLKTSAIDVNVESKMCAVTNKASPNPVLHKGIDVSVWNGDINWPTVATQVDFVIMRASWEETADTKFHTNAKGCQDNGIPFGVYVYSYAETEEEAIGEAEYVLSLVDGYDITLPIYFDFEDEVQMNLSTSMKKAVVKAFCDTIYAAGYQPGVYTYKWILTSVLTDAYFKTLPTWVAEINGASYTSYEGGLTMWQYSWVGSFSGMSGDVDCNYMYVELPGTGSSDKSYLASCTYYPSNLSVTLNSNANMRQYPASGYTLLETIPSGTNLHVTGLYKNTYGNFWYQVEYNGKTGYVASEYADVNEYLFDDISVQNPDMASNLASGKGYYIRGDLSSVYNNLTTVNTKVYSGEDTTATPVLKSSYSPNSKAYSLYKSEVDYGLLFGSQSAGYYTYEISADVKNYSASGTTLSSKTENVVVWTSTYTVDNATVVPPETNICTHSTVIKPAVAAGCTTTGLTEGSYCSLCGEVFKEQTVVEAKGHNYKSTEFAATCKDYAYTVYTCSVCSASYTETVTPTYSDWLETYPEGVDESRVDVKTQYRYSDYETISNYESSVKGYELQGMEWESQGTKTLDYVKSWPEGYDTTNSHYKAYNNTPVADFENAYTKATVHSDEHIGYVYYHWCRGTYTEGPINRTTSQTKSDPHITFHSFFSTTDPSTLTTASDSSVTYANADCCKDTWWYYNVPVYRQSYTDYKALYTHAGWSEFSDWSDTEYIESATRKVESRQVYRYAIAGGLSDHKFVNGVCSVCGEAEPPQDMYLFGNINGADYGNNADSANIGTYKFKDGKLVTTFTEDSYVGVKTEDNLQWYMTNGSVGKVTSAILYNTSVLGDDADLLYVPKGREVTFTLSDNGNDTYTLSYTLAECAHENHNTDAVCTLCSEVVEHSYTDGVCTICGKVCAHSFTNGKCIYCAYRCQHSEYIDGKCAICFLSCKHSYTDSICTTCGNVCTHSYTEGICTTCGKVCKHSYTEGACSECGYICNHQWQGGVCVVCGLDCEHNFVSGTCSICSSECDHSFTDGCCTKCALVCEPHYYQEGYCIVCGKSEPSYYLFGYINGADYACNDDYQNIGIYRFVDGTLKAKFTHDSYVAVKTWDNQNWYMTNRYPGNNVTIAVLYNTSVLGSNADKLFVPKGREITFTLTDNGNDTFTLSYTVAPCEHLSHTTDGLCSECSVNISHVYSSEGICSVCGKVCEHTFRSGVCITCGFKCTHSFDSNGFCSICGIACNHKWSEGLCLLCNTACEHTFSEGKCETCGYACKHSFSSGVCTDCGISCEHTFANGECTICGTICEHSYSDGLCTACGISCNHQLKGDSCAVCDMSFSFVLAGYINGTDTGCEEDYQSSGYAFENGKLSLNITEDSFVFVKTKCNQLWFMAENDDRKSSVNLYNTKASDARNMMFIPAGIEAELSLVASDDGTLTLSYVIVSCNHTNREVDGACVACGQKEPVPAFALKYTRMNFENDIRYAVYFDVENMENVAYSDMGLAVFDNENTDGTVDTASSLLAGAKEDKGYLSVQTDQIFAHKLGDTVYFKVYAKLADGSYIYSDLLSYSGVRYAYMVLDNPNSSTAEKALMVALLNYGAELQKYQSYNTDKLMNAKLTSEQKKLVKDYDSSMADKPVAVDKAKAGEFAKSGKGVVFYPTATFNSEQFALDYSFKAKDITGDVRLYCWDKAAFEAADVLTKDNAIGSVGLGLQNGMYTATVYDIPAKDLDSTIYVAVLYSTESGTCSSGVLAYSPAEFLKIHAANEKSELNALSKAGVVFGYYAKSFFAE